LTASDDDRDLKDRFAARRRDEESRVPGFAGMWATAQRVSAGGASAGRRRKTVSGVRLFTAAVVIAALAGVYRMAAPPEPAPAVDWQLAASLAAWRAPTDFLLNTPGRETLRTVPRLVSPIPGPFDLKGAEIR
jgi:hypothetical protein